MSNQQYYNDFTMDDLRDMINDLTQDAPERPRLVDPDTWARAMTSTTPTVTTNATDGVVYVDAQATDSAPAQPTQADGDDLERLLEEESVAEVGRLIDSGEVAVTEDGERLSFHGPEEEEVPEEVSDSDFVEVPVPRRRKRDDEKKPPKKEETAKQVRARLRKEDPNYAENAKTQIRIKTIENLTNLNKKRSIPTEYVKSILLSHSMIVFDKKGNFVHTTRAEAEVYEMGHAASHSMVFDKQFNLLAPINGKIRLRRPNAPRKRVQHHGTRINSRQIQKRDTTQVIGPLTRNFVIVDKELLITSPEQKFKILRKSAMKPVDIVHVKKTFFKALSEMQEAVAYVSNAVGQVLPPEDFEVLYELRSLRGINYMTLSMRFRDVTIANSLEMEREIGDIIVTQTIEHWLDTTASRPYLKFNSDLKGLRMKWTFVDANAGYQHSHIPSGNPETFNNFCTGNQDYTLNEANSMAIEAHVHRLREFVSWESLEGGPHYRMESIKTAGTTFTLTDNIHRATIPDHRYWKEMWNRLKSDPSYIRSLERCFRLVRGERGLMWTLDSHQFYLKMMEIFDGNALAQCSRWDRGQSYHYKDHSGKFFKITGRGETDPIRMFQKSIEKVMKIHPVYMNGRYIKPEVNQYEDPYNGLRFCPQPQLMYEVGNVILYHLTEKLEEYGNTSNKAKG